MKLLRLILASYIFIWFTFVVPVHTRGMITLPGSYAGDSCCAPKPACCDKPDSPKKSDKPTPEQQQRCAVCFVAANYMLPPVFHIDLRHTAQADQFNCFAVPQVLSREYPVPYWPVGPPALV